jgi:hypothetical protein
MGGQCSFPEVAPTIRRDESSLARRADDAYSLQYSEEAQRRQWRFSAAD